MNLASSPRDEIKVEKDAAKFRQQKGRWCETDTSTLINQLVPSEEASFASDGCWLASLVNHSPSLSSKTGWKQAGDIWANDKGDTFPNTARSFRG
jgi:hypothetical protein